MATIRRKRKREIQDDKTDFENNFDYLRYLNDQKRRKTNIENTPNNTVTFNSTKDYRKFATLKEHTLWSQPPVTPSHTPNARFPSQTVHQSLQKKRFSTLRGSLRLRMKKSILKQKMKGLQDYRAPYFSSLDVHYLHFLSEIEHKMKLGQPVSQQDQTLQTKIDHEIKMRDGSAKMLAASKHPGQMLEASKNLLTSNLRMMAYMAELQKRNTNEALHRNLSIEGDQTPCRAVVSVSDLRIPLMWKETDHFKNKGDHRRYAVFCLWKIGTEVFDTDLIRDVDRTMTDLSFDNILNFNDVSHDFECELEVYCHKLHDDLTIASTPKKLKKKFNNISHSVGRSVGRRLSGLKEDTDIMANMLVGPRFELVAHAKLCLRDVSEHVNTFDLELDNANVTVSADGTSNELPLFGNFCCRIAAQPLCLTQLTTSGYLDLKLPSDGGSVWNRLWCELSNLRVSCWETSHDQSHDQNKDEPVHVIPVTKDTQISEGDPSIESTQHSLHINTCVHNKRAEYTLAAEDEQQLAKWWDGLQQHLLDQALWGHACETLMKIELDTSTDRLSTFTRQPSLRFNSCIPETPLKKPVRDQLQSTDSPLTKILNRLAADESKPKNIKSSRRESLDNTRLSYGMQVGRSESLEKSRQTYKSLDSTLMEHSNTLQSEKLETDI